MQHPQSSIARLRRSFMRREDGSVAVEAMIVLPLMFWAFLCLFAIHDAWRAYGMHEKAALSIGDAVSREKLPIDAAYLDGAHDIFEYLARSEGSTELRLSQLWYEEENDVYRLDWSHVRGNLNTLTDEEVANWHAKLPTMSDNERVLLLETTSAYRPAFDTGLTLDEIRTYVFTRPRYRPRVCFDTCN